MERTDVAVDAFLDGVDDPRAGDLRALDRVIADELAGLERVLWQGVMWGGTEQRIIGYGGIRQPRPRGADVEWFLVGLAMQQRHLSVYVNAVEGGEYLVQARRTVLGRVKVGAAAITFTRLDDLDLEAFRLLVRRARELAGDAT
ncbi:hypothetical protein [Agromyces sp. NPDC058110]|uniref:hypothetical protein n=1 Tax=Agromyces sp. NPDC058110 TaxID=3346345 RepID=UPI0036DE2DD1